MSDKRSRKRKLKVTVSLGMSDTTKTVAIDPQDDEAAFWEIAEQIRLEETSVVWEIVEE
mgnify:CR=1 FL=1